MALNGDGRPPTQAGAPRGGGFTRSWRWLGAAEGLVTSAVLVVVVGVVTYAATRPAARVTWDLTPAERYTLSDETGAFLKTLEQPVEFISIMQPEVLAFDTGLTAVQLKAADYVNTLLGQYAQESDGRVSVSVLDPHRDRPAIEDLKRELHLTRFNVVLVRGPTRTELVFLDELATIDRGLGDPENIRAAELRALHAEAPLTSALLSVSSGTRPKVGVLTGWGGPRPESFDMFDLGLFAENVRGQGFEVVPVNLNEGDGALEGLEALVVWGPELDPGRRVGDALRRFADAGGGLLLALDPMFSSPDVDELLAHLGLVRERAILCRLDLPTAGPDRAQLTLTRFHPEHPITAPVAAMGTFARVYAAGGLARSPAAPPARLTEALITSPGEVFGDQLLPGQPSGNWALDEGEQRGARVLGYAVSDPGGGRAVVYGNGAFLTNGFLGDAGGGPANLPLGLNAVNWLVGREQAIDVAPRPVYVSRVDLLEDELARIVLYVLVFMPLAGAGLGVLIWFVRRR